MRKIKLFEPQIEIRISVTDEMDEDMRACRRAMELGIDGPDCTKCSWGDVELLGTGLCELEDVVRQVMEKEENHGEINTCKEQRD